MYELVKTFKQQKAFERTWEFFCEKYKWYNDPYAKNGIRYNLFVRQFVKKKVIGTIEFIPYDPKNPNSTVEGPKKANFSQYNQIMLHQKQTWEIDKLCIHENYQRQGQFPYFMDIFADHINEHIPKYYLALIEKKFYRMLRLALGSAVEQRGEALIGPKTILIPVVVDVKMVIQNGGVKRERFGKKTPRILHEKSSAIL
ncbi:hypothetical protein [Lentibacillus sp. Marseille-P4043]|uniref:hypothetical protein n=1 Tax=Lentibacillus sp. Marseille-P4043 TaxID=2040293 RepID=UPI000D0B31D0|nr:hypothetical protein [Lentibacillus sp. Marseille-P4043]